MFQKLKEKAGYLAVAAPVALLSAPAFAGDFSAAVTAGTDKISGMSGDVVNIYTAMIGIAALFWVGRRVVRSF